ncbi:MAG: hypothetical protein HC822_20985 [Oscillochloris sp.]|nr:hypothetical protein [Oscillochloris sp.]
MAARHANLERYLAADPWLTAAAEAAERLAQIAAERRLELLEHLINAGLREALIVRTGRVYHGPLDDDLLNGLLFFAGEDVSQPLLQALLRAHMAGDSGWRERLPENAAFLARLQQRGIDPAAWLAARPRMVHLADAPGERISLRMATTGLQVLQMGNYFDTCLAREGVNAFSALSNAIDLNKRVLYAYRADGQVLGRKLIALSNEGRLLGYHCYTRGLNDSASAALAEAMRRYLLEFAAACGLETADHGDVENLVAEHWYNDGAQPWTTEAAVGAGSR